MNFLKRRSAKSVDIPYHTMNSYPSRADFSGIRSQSTVIYLVVIILCLGVTLTFLNIYQLHQMKSEHKLHKNSNPSTVVEGGVGKFVEKRQVLWVFAKNKKSGYLQHVYNVFQRVSFNTEGEQYSPWDVLWSHDYPFVTLGVEMANLLPHQKVNHFPGSGFITNKASLATTAYSFVPQAFKMPGDRQKFIDFSNHHPEKMWVQKSNQHRGIQVKDMNGLDLDNEATFIQEYVAKPFLIDDRKFDIGIYTILTSINPLRVYIIEGDCLVRFCPNPYHPFDPKDLQKYVVGDDYMPVWEVPSLKKLFTENKYTFRETFNSYLRSIGKDTGKLWSDLRMAIREVYLDKEKNLIDATSRFKTTRNFFELVRFDFVVDEELKVYLMEVNMSPNLSSGHFPPNKHLYEHVLFNLLSLVGLARSTGSPAQLSPQDEADMQVSDRNIKVFADTCTSKLCTESCYSQICKLCERCLSENMKVVLKDAYLEHVNRGSARRVFPPPMLQGTAFQWEPSRDKMFQELNANNKLIYAWFVGKCRQDAAWCV